MSDYLTFHPRLYLGDGIKKEKLDKIKKKLLTKPLLANVYIITLSEHPDNQLEFFESKQLIQRFFRNHSRQVIGIAADYGDSVRLVEKIVQECLEARGDCNLREYLLC